MVIIRISAACPPEQSHVLKSFYRLFLFLLHNSSVHHYFMSDYNTTLLESGTKRCFTRWLGNSVFYNSFLTVLNHNGTVFKEHDSHMCGESHFLLGALNRPNTVTLCLIYQP